MSLNRISISPKLIISSFISFSLLYGGFSWFLLRFANAQELIPFVPSTNIFAAVVLGLVNLSLPLLMLRQYKLNLNWIDIALIAFSIWTLLSIIWSQNMSFAWSYFLLTGLSLIFYCNLKACFRIDAKHTIKWIIITTCFIVFFLTLHFFVQLYLQHKVYADKFDGYQFGLSVIQSTSGLIGKKNWITKFILILIPVLALGFQYKKFNKGIYLAYAMIIGLILLINTRSTLIALILGCLLFLLFTLGDRKRRISYFIAGGLFLTVFLFWLVDPYNYVSNLNLIEAWSSRSIAMRLIMWDMCISMFNQSPIIGHGIGQWEILHQQFGLVDNLRVSRHYGHPHNDFLRVLAELGLIGLMAFFSFYVLQLKSLWNNRSEGVAFLIGIAFIPSYLLVSIFDENLYKLPNQIFLMIPLAYYSFSTHGSIKMWKSIKLGILIFMLIVPMFGFLMLRKEKKSYKLKELVDAKAWTEVVKQPALKNTFYYDSYKRYPLDYLQGLGEFKTNNIEASYLSFVEAQKVYPYNKANLLYLSRSLTYLEKEKEAIQLISEAIEYYPYYDPYYFELVKNNLIVNDIVLAQKYLDKIEKSSKLKRKYQKQINDKLKN